MLEYRLQWEGYWVKTLCTGLPYGLNERTKVLSKVSKGKFSSDFQDMVSALLTPQHFPK